MIDVDLRFVQAVRQSCKGQWHIINDENYKYDCKAYCARCQDTIYGLDQIKALVEPGYHCWCDR